MKQAKIMLSAIAIFAVVGAAFAFNAHRSPIQFFTPNPHNSAICDQPLTVVGVTTTDQSQTPIVATFDQSADCTTLYYQGE